MANLLLILSLLSFEEVGPRNIVQVIIEYAKIYRAIGLLVEEHYSNNFWTPYVVHSLNLMLQMIGNKIDWMEELYVEAKEIQMFVTNHHMLQDI